MLSVGYATARSQEGYRHCKYGKCIPGPLGLIQLACGARSAGRRSLNQLHEGVAACAKARRRVRKSFAKRPQSSIGKGIAPPPSPISCEPLVWKKAGFTGTLRAKKNLLEMPSTTLI